ncbi:ATP-binding cassette domain-containing protein, partial [Klebsiella variicola]
MRKRQYIGLSIFLLMAMLSVIGPWLAPYAVDEIRDMPFALPSVGAWAGTDYLGADVLSRVMSGGRQLLLFASFSVLLSWLLGGMLGMLAACKGSWIDRLFLSIADILLSVPGLLLLTLVVAVSGRGYLAGVIATILVMLPDIFRLTRAATLHQLQQDYVEIARCRGESVHAILCREIAPNLLPLLNADIGIRLLSAIFILATASFLGLGAVQPQADWGLMIMENRQGLTFQPWATLAPIIAILLLVIPLNMSLDDLLVKNPRSKLKFKPSTGESVSSESFPLELVQVTLQLPGQVLLKDVTLQLRRGEIVALIGASGSGKSTLLRAALGQFPPATDTISGELRVAGHSLAAIEPRALRQLRAGLVGYVPQDPRLSLVPSQTIGTYLRLIGRSRGLSRQLREQQSQAHFQQLGLPDDPDFLHRYPHEISGGQRQRIMAVAAMLGYPALLIMDEPTSALDVISTQAVMQWIASTARIQGMTVLFVAHDLPHASQIADRIVVMAQGRLTEQRCAQEFMQAPLSQAGRLLLDAWQPCVLPQANLKRSLPVLISEKLSARYATHLALAPVSFSLGYGETLTIAGRSGG